MHFLRLCRLDRPVRAVQIAAMSQDGSSAGAKCPICGRPTERQWRPFCSKRCADIDLGHWLTGTYAVPAEEAPDPDEEG